MGRPAAALALLVLLASECTSHPPHPPEPTGSATPSGALTIAYPAEPATLNPFAAAGDTPATHDLARMLMPGLYKITASGARVRWLLASEPVESKGPPFSVTVALRQDAMWSDGRPITVEDLRFTWQLAARAPIARAGYDQIARVVTLTPKRARIDFRAPFTQWRDLFSAGLGVLPAHALSTSRAQVGLSSGWPVSGGPFVLKAWHHGLDMVFEPNPHTWDAKPKLQSLRVVFVPDALGALTLFHSGAVDALGPYQAPDWIKRVSATPGGSVTTDTGLTWMGVVLNARSKPLSDVKVRRAFADSMDRGLLVRGLVQGEGESLDAIPPATSGPFASYGDVARARTTLSNDGWRGGPIRTKGGAKLSFTIAVADSDDLGQVLAHAIQYQAAQASIDVQMVTLPIDEIESSWLTGPRYQAAILEWRDPPGGASRARFGGTQASIAASVPIIPLATLAVTLVASARAHGLVASAEADGPFWNVEQWSVS